MYQRMRTGNFHLLLLLVFAINGCASIRTSEGTAIIYSTVFEIPVVYGNSVFVESIDGKQVDRSKGYVEVEPGERIIRVGYVSCVFPIFIFTCLSDFGVVEIEATLEPNVDYRLYRDFEVRLEEDRTGKVIAR